MTDAQKQIVEKAIKDANETGLWGNKIITEVKPFTNFFQAEEEHQKYLEKTQMVILVIIPVVIGIFRINFYKQITEACRP